MTLKISIHILNWVPSKSLPKIHFKLKARWKQSLKCLKDVNILLKSRFIILVSFFILLVVDYTWYFNSISHRTNIILNNGDSWGLFHTRITTIGIRASKVFILVYWDHFIRSLIMSSMQYDILLLNRNTGFPVASKVERCSYSDWFTQGVFGFRENARFMDDRR